MRHHFGILSSLLIMCSACAGSLRPTHPIVDPMRALERQTATSAGLRAIRAEARVDQRKAGGRIRGTVLMFVEQTGRVRFDVMTQFGPVAILTSDGQQFAYSDFRGQKFLTGPTCPLNVARFLGMQLSAEETARFLLGGTSVLEPHLVKESKLELGDDGHYHIELEAQSGARQQLELAVYTTDLESSEAQQRLYLVRSELWNEQGQKVWRVSYEDYQPITLDKRKLLVPMRVHIEHAGQQSDTLVHFKKIESNPTIEDAVFVQSPRAGMQQEEAPCE
jgi:Domain of unknown function (DUF4292)